MQHLHARPYALPICGAMHMSSPPWVCLPLQADLATYNQTLYNATGAIIDPLYCNQTQLLDSSGGGAGARRASVPLTLTLTAVAAAAALAAL